MVVYIGEGFSKKRIMEFLELDRLRTWFITLGHINNVKTKKVHIFTLEKMLEGRLYRLDCNGDLNQHKL